MATKTCNQSCKGYGLSYVLNLPGSITFRSLSVLENLDKFFKPPILSDYSISILDICFMALSVTKYTKKDLQRILKTILEA